MNKIYLVAFEIGDKSNDGHGRYDYVDYLANYHSDQIEYAIDEACKLMEFDLYTLGSDYEEHGIAKEWLPLLEKFGLISYGVDDINEDLGLLWLDEYEDFCEIFLKAARLIIPDLIWEVHRKPVRRIINSKPLGYGFFLS